MAFRARIELIGLFRFWPDKTKRGGVRKIYGLAPWTGRGAGKPGKAAESQGPSVDLHHFAATWWPRSLQPGVPPVAMTVWPLGGMEVTFDFESRKRRGLDVRFDELNLPVMTREKEDRRRQDGPDTIAPPQLHSQAKLDRKYVETPAGEFEVDRCGGGRYTDHLGIVKNTLGLMGRVVIDQGKVETDDLTGVQSYLDPTLWPDQARYTGFFTNRLTVTVPECRSLTLRARNLITGRPAGEMQLTTADRQLLVQILHLCPEQILAECPERPVGAGSERDEDFHRLYDLSMDGDALRRGEEGATVPTGYYDGHTCRRVRCGSCAS